MCSLSQPPGRPDPPSAVGCQEEQAGGQAVQPGGVQHKEGVPGKGTGGLGKLAFLTSGQGAEGSATLNISNSGGNSFLS